MRRKTISSVIATIPFDQCPAKTYSNSLGEKKIGRTVLNHCQIVGEVARLLINRYPESIRKAIFPESAHFAAAAHDIGKVSPTFYEKIISNCTSLPEKTIRLLGVNPSIESVWGGHAGVSQLTANHLNAPHYIAEILGMHHGFAPAIAGMRAEDERFGGAAWQQEREKLVSQLKKDLNADWPIVDSVAQARALAGLTSVADWIGSGELFEDPSLSWQHSIEKSLDQAGLIPPTYKKNLSFDEVFGFAPRSTQTVFINQVKSTGVYVLEAAMGVGKTEAALYSAYQLLQTQQATGIYFALPTQLTSNKIYERFNAFLAEILDSQCKHRSLLLHSYSWLVDIEMGEEGQPGGAWFNHTKRGLLAPFAVGTIDQCLMAAMNVKHGSVRAFGLAGKVVILDEVHTYDAYTGTLLDALVTLLRNLHCTVIILSATLYQERRQEIVGFSDLTSQAYPLITTHTNDGVKEINVKVIEQKNYNICLKQSDEEAVKEVLLRASQGQQVIWIENTVKEAQARYLDFAARAYEAEIDCGLLHSRFTSIDRQHIEEKWVNVFGKAGLSTRMQRGRILVGTQVLEQSLDIDADFMVSRFAPSDLLLQRIGRLWRHDKTPRPLTALPELWVLAPDLDSAIEHPEIAFGPSAFVYSPYVLCRSLEVWALLTHLSLPKDMRSLIEKTYVSRPEVGVMTRWLHELDHGTKGRGQVKRIGRNALKQLARISLVDIGKTQPEEHAQTRYSQIDSLDVLLLRSIHLNIEKQTTILHLLDQTTLCLPWKRALLSKKQWRELSIKLMKQLVKVQPQDAPISLPINTLRKIGLHHCFYLGEPSLDEALLRVALVSNTDNLTGVFGADIHSKYQIEYRQDLGYRVLITEERKNG